MSKFKDVTCKIMEGVCAAGTALLTVLGVVVVAAASSSLEVHSYERPGYYSAVKTITNSDMFESTKQKLVKIINREGEAEYYQTVIEIVKSNMFESTKIRMIEDLSKREVESE